MAFGEHFRSKPDNFTLLKYRAKEQELRIEWFEDQTGVSTEVFRFCSARFLAKEWLPLSFKRTFLAWDTWWLLSHSRLLIYKAHSPNRARWRHEGALTLLNVSEVHNWTKIRVNITSTPLFPSKMTEVGIWLCSLI
jgi:hypothetical protein